MIAIPATPATATAEAGHLLEPPADLEWPPDLPRRVRVYQMQLCDRVPGEAGGTFIDPIAPRVCTDAPDGWLLPDDLAIHAVKRLMYLDSQRGLCRKKLHGLDDVRRAEAKLSVDTCEAVSRERLLHVTQQPPEGFTTLEVFGAAAIGAGIGAAIVVVVVGGLAASGGL